MKENLFISILICCYNSEKFITQTLTSIIEQNYNNYEIIIIDDGSTDTTKEKIHTTLINKKFTYFYQQNKGLSEARNIGIKLSKSNYVFLLDHDDIMIKNRIVNQVKEIQDHNNYAIYFGDSYIGIEKKITKFDLYLKKYKLNLKNEIINNLFLDKYLLIYGCFIASSTVVLNKKLISGSKLDKNYSYVSDFSFFVTLAKISKFYKSKHIYAIWRRNDNQISSINQKNNLSENIKMYNNFFFNNFSYLLNYNILISYAKLLIKYFYLRCTKI